MDIIQHQGYIEVCLHEAFAPHHTFACGQCFRWRPDGQGRYRGVAFGKELTVWGTDSLCMTCTPAEFEAHWRGYFDLDRNYTAITQAFQGDAYFEDAVRFGMGLRLLVQEPWEALCSFILSQCNNIGRIQGIIDSFCAAFGQDMGGFYAFPTAEQVAAQTLDRLQVMRAGYRAKYVLHAAQAVASGRLDFEKLRAMPTEQARAAVMELNGVGRKVADCFLLFGLGKYDAFPVDTWMKKAESHYDKGRYGANFGPFAGIAQQYIFYYARSGR